MARRASSIGKFCLIMAIVNELLGPQPGPTHPRFETGDILTNSIAIKEAAGPTLKNANRVCDGQEEVILRLTILRC